MISFSNNLVYITCDKVHIVVFLNQTEQNFSSLVILILTKFTDRNHDITRDLYLNHNNTLLPPPHTHMHVCASRMNFINMFQFW